MMTMRGKPAQTRVARVRKQSWLPVDLVVESLGGRFPPRLSIGMSRPAAFLRLMGYSLFPIPLLLLLIYLVTQFPRPQESLHIYPSLVSVPRSNRVWEIYDEDYFPGGGYAVLPYGRVSLRLDLFAPHIHAYKVRYWLMGPEDGEKASWRVYLVAVLTCYPFRSS